MVKNKFFILLGWLLLNHILIAQTPLSNDDRMTWSYESTPSFDNDKSQDKLIRFVNANIMQVDTLKVEAIVYVQFEVDTLGFTHQHTILKGVNEQLDSEALRVCRLIRFDHPAIKGGKPACFTYLLPVKFKPNTPPNNPKRRACCFWRKKK